MNYSRFLTSDEIITLPATFSDGTQADTHWKKCAHVDFERWRQAEQADRHWQRQLLLQQRAGEGGAQTAAAAEAPKPEPVPAPAVHRLSFRGEGSAAA